LPRLVLRRGTPSGRSHPASESRSAATARACATASATLKGAPATRQRPGAWRLGDSPSHTGSVRPSRRR
jgi:hypothetical protein